jgi:hypothetical protein
MSGCDTVFPLLIFSWWLAAVQHIFSGNKILLKCGLAKQITFYCQKDWSNWSSLPPYEEATCHDFLSMLYVICHQTALFCWIQTPLGAQMDRAPGYGCATDTCPHFTMAGMTVVTLLTSITGHHLYTSVLSK